MKKNKIDSHVVLQIASDLKKMKSEDYQGSVFTEEDYFPFGHLSYLHMIHTKYYRIRSVVEQDDTNFESLEDSLLDIINYCAMYYAWVHNENHSDE